MANLKTNYKNDILDTSENTNRVYDLVDQNGRVVLANLSIVDKTVYSQTGDNYGATEINAQNNAINKNTKNVSWYGTCTTAQATQQKAVTTDDGAFTLVKGAKVTVKFTSTNTASNPTLKVDNTTAKSIKSLGATNVTVWWQSGDVVTFVYDGTNWIMGATQGEIEQINNNLTASNDQPFKFDYDSVSGKYGYVVESGGADTFIPFSSMPKASFSVVYGSDPQAAAYSVFLFANYENGTFNALQVENTAYGTNLDNDYVKLESPAWNSKTVTLKQDAVKFKNGVISNVSAGLQPDNVGYQGDLKQITWLFF